MSTCRSTRLPTGTRRTVATRHPGPPGFQRKPTPHPGAVLDGVINLSAVMDRSPGPNAGLALTQHEFDRAWVWLTQGERVQVDVAGSAYNNNTLHFVRIDTDASDPSSSAGWTVGGVACSLRTPSGVSICTGSA